MVKLFFYIGGFIFIAYGAITVTSGAVDLIAKIAARAAGI